jgi:hypothetical protein
MSTLDLADYEERWRMAAGLDVPRHDGKITEAQEAAIVAAIEANPSKREVLCAILSKYVALQVLTYLHEHPRSTPSAMNEVINTHLKRREEVVGTASMRAGCQVIGRYLHELRRYGFATRHLDKTWSLKS